MKKLILPFLLLICSSIHAQNESSDSIRIMQKIRTISQSAGIMASVPDSIIDALIACKQEAKKTKNIILYCQSMNALAFSKMRKQEFEKAKKEYQNSIDLLKENLDKLPNPEAEILLIKTKLNYTVTLSHENKQEECLKLRLELLKDLPEDKATRSLVIGNVGASYRDVSNHEKAIEYWKKALHVYDTIENNPATPRLYLLMGKSYDNLDKLDSALYYFASAKELCKDQIQLYNAGILGMAQIYKQQKKFAKSTKLFLEAAAVYPKDSKDPYLNEIKILIALNYSEQGKHALAIKYFKEVEPLLKNDEELRTQMDFYDIGSIIYSKSGNYKKAFDYLKEYEVVYDSLTSMEKMKEFKTIESKYEVAKKQETINAQKIKIRNYGLGLLGLLALAVIGGLLFFNYKKQQSLKEKLATQEVKAKEAEIENLKKENKLISMSAMLEGQEEERKRIAQDLHDNIGTLMTSIKMKFLTIQKEIESISKLNIADELDGMINNASQEVRRISHRMTPKILEHAGLHDSVQELEVQLRDNNMEVKSNIEALKGINDKKIELNLYRIVQETYSNIIKHSGADKVSIVTDKKENKLVLRIRDNGKGISKEKWDNKNTLGINGIKSRVNYLNGEIKLVEDSGTHFKLSIPLS